MHQLELLLEALEDVEEDDAHEDQLGAEDEAKGEGDGQSLDELSQQRGQLLFRLD